MSATDHFSQDTTGLPQSRATEIVDVAPGGSFELGIAAVRKRIGEAEVHVLAYNGSVPGPTLRVAERSQIEVDVVNEGGSGGDDALARPAPRQSLGRHARDAGADSHRRALLVHGGVPRSRPQYIASEIARAAAQVSQPSAVRAAA